MPKLMIDIDLTILASLANIQYIHPEHTLSTPLEATTTSREHMVCLINVEALSRLIDIACVNYDGIILFTAGSWHKSIRTLLANNLNLSHIAHKKVKECLLLSPDVCMNNFPESSLNEIRNMPKSQRFDKYLAKYADLRRQHFVFLDDNINHVSSFSQSRQVIPIHATTHQSGKRFYQTTVTALAKAKVNEQQSIYAWLNTFSSLFNMCYGKKNIEEEEGFNPTTPSRTNVARRC
jgi:hypothetical protein